MTPLRKKMIRELELQRKAPTTIVAYIAAVFDLTRFYRRSPDQISVEEVRDYIHNLIVERSASYSTCNVRLAGLRFFYQQVLGRDNFAVRIPIKRSGKLPEPLSREEIERLLSVTSNQKHRLLLMTTYASGVRVSELVRLRCEDIHSERMLIRVNDGKGHKDRYTLLSKQLLMELRSYWRAYRPGHWFVSQPKAPGSALQRDSAKIDRGIHSRRCKPKQPGPLWSAEQRCWEARGIGVGAVMRSTCIAAVVTDIVPSARRLPGRSGLRRVVGNCSRCPTFTMCSRCLTSSMRLWAGPMRISVSC